MNTRITAEKAYVIGVQTSKVSKFEAMDSMLESVNLARSAGAELLGQDLVEVRAFHPATFFGQGKVAEFKELFAQLKIELVVVDHVLSPVQNRNLEKTWCVRVVDRTGLILDIFAQRARSKEGKIQVELAQYEYLLPRLIGAWTHLSKQRGGGVGLRGPGETQLEVDRRRARERITALKRDLKKVASTRDLQREKRLRTPIPTIALVGYTNAGKSTLFNRVTGVHDLGEDKLFATLDPKTKKIRLPSGQKVLLSDTVGFIKNLPHELVESFKSTFKEVQESDILVHVIDASHPDRAQQIQTVESLITELGLNDKPLIRVMNKVDKLPDELLEPEVLGALQTAVRVSALEGTGMEQLLFKMEDELSKAYYRRMQLFIPYQEAKVLSTLYTHGTVHVSHSNDKGSYLEVDLPPKFQKMYESFEVLLEEPEAEPSYG